MLMIVLCILTAQAAEDDTETAQQLCANVSMYACLLQHKRAAHAYPTAHVY
jgi:hypothetical protein